MRPGLWPHHPEHAPAHLISEVGPGQGILRSSNFQKDPTIRTCTTKGPDSLALSSISRRLSMEKY